MTEKIFKRVNAAWDEIESFVGELAPKQQQSRRIVLQTSKFSCIAKSLNRSRP